MCVCFQKKIFVTKQTRDNSFNGRVLAKYFELQPQTFFIPTWLKETDDCDADD